MNARRQAPTLCHVVFLIGKLPLGPLSVLCPHPWFRCWEVCACVRTSASQLLHTLQLSVISLQKRSRPWGRTEIQVSAS